MSLVVQNYFQELEALLSNSPAIAQYVILRQAIREAGSFIRFKAAIVNEGTLEIFEYVDDDEPPNVIDYSYHWQNKQGDILKRWDNAPHFPNLPNAPHHIHLDDESVVGAVRVADLAAVLTEIEQVLGV